ncbi:nitroreductase family deazaflavin-dependent oxidoreductase [Williamsia sp. CHRR-6]|uniref:nitroreductase family deazaflavin-dependent oxidoreductase n=1 Tax=Williamsia sp. CHRR-6 TaxID=2835871 RepID=UPI001BD9F4C0|nr:nitroreductase family deazaflavin-dependent oxidoreductase [Williamsia sp. CHRR-6]MBT0568152.1 nitroreductase family deazaflavin-dependent oxidoreductase [Williamsia sp. CHRR-6]
MGVLTPLAVRLGSTAWMPRLLPVIERTDSSLQRLTRGRISLLDLAGLPNLMLRVPGRSTGIMRATPLLAVRGQTEAHTSWLIAGSYFGNARTPAWVHNLRAAIADDRTADITIRGKTTTVQARELSGHERADAWTALLAIWPNFALYEQRTSRVIPVFRLTAA